MTAKTCRNALHTIFGTVVPALVLVIGEPDSIAATPLLYTVLDSFDVEDTDNAELRAVTWRFTHRLVYGYQDNAAAEDLLLDAVDAILDAVQADPKLSNLLHHSGRAQITAGDAGFTEIPSGGTKYRTCDLASEVLEITEHA